jgi:hypothetical protein
MTQDIKDVLKLALEWAEAHGEIVFAGGGMDAVNKMNSWATAIKEALREHVMREVQRLGQEIEQEPVDCEKLALLGWQAVECSICGSSAKAFTKPEQDHIPDARKMVTEQEPFCYHDGRNIVGKEYADHSDVFPLYTEPPQRTWVGLTPQERDEINEQVYGAVPHHVAFHAAIEAKLKELNS